MTVRIEDLTLTEPDGTVCLPQDALDDIWPLDDREPLIVTGKGIMLPPTCEEIHGRETCIKFVFGGEETPIVPLSETAVFMGSALVAMWIWGKVR
jgi:hypothetical protein